MAVVSLLFNVSSAKHVPAPSVQGQGECHEREFVQCLRKQEICVVGKVVDRPG